MWINSLICLILAAVFCLPLTWLFRCLGIKMGIYSKPGGRNVHKAPIPRVGGVSVFIAFILTLCVVFHVKDFFHWNLPRVTEQPLLLPLLCGAACICLLGFLDDKWDMRARYKMLIQIAVAVGMYSFGFKIHAIQFPVLGILNLGDFSPVFTVLWIVGTINAVNLIDGIDGLCSSFVICSLLGIFCMAIFSGVDIAGIICSALIGCMLVFLVFNFQPASIFLGDSGAYFLGFMIAALSVFIASESSSPGVFPVSFIVFMFVPFIDTGLSILRRLLYGIKMSTPDREHLHHRLLDKKGYSHKKITAVLSLISFVFTIAGVTFAIGNNWQAMIGLIITMTAVCLLMHLCGIRSLRHLRF